MCAANFSDRRAALSAIRFYGQLAQGSALSAQAIGRVGALAVALGVGGAILGFTPVASAEAGSGDSAGARQESGRTESSPRRGTPTGRSGGAAAAEAPKGSTQSSRAARSGRGSTAVDSDAVVGTARDSHVPAPVVAAIQAPAAADPAPVITPDAAPVTIEESAPVVAVPAAGDSPAGSGVSPVPVGTAVALAAVAEEAPVMTASPDALAEGEVDPTALLGEDGSGEPGAEPLAWAALAMTRREDLAGATPEVGAAAAVTNGEPVEPLAAAAGDVAADTFTVPPVPSGCSGLDTVCTALVAARPTVIQDIATNVVAAYGTAAGIAGQCSGNTCPAGPANYIGAYAFNIIYALMGATNATGTNPLPNTTVGSAVQALFAQPQILTFISETVVAGNAALAKVPPEVALTVGNAVGTFILNSLGNNTVANAFVPFLRALNIPTGLTQAGIFATAAGSNVFAAILKSGNRQINPTGMQSALVTFFTTPGVVSQLASAVTAAVNVLLGLDTQPSWAGEPQVSPIALSSFIGQLGANMLLPEDNPNNPALAGTIGNAVQTLFSNIGGVVATQAGAAFQAFLNAPGQNVPSILATTIVNGFVVILQEGAQQQPNPPFPNQPPLLPSLAPAAGYAVTGFVNAVLSDPTVTEGLGQFVTQVVPGILGNQGIQNEIYSTVSNLVSTLVGGNLGAVVGPQVGAAVLSLVTNPTVITALTTFVDTAAGNFLNSPGVVGQLADAAGDLASAQLEGTLDQVLPQVEQDLRASIDIQNGVNTGVSLAVQGLLSDTAVWAAVDSTLTTLVGTLLGDVVVQQALAQDVAALVEQRIPGPVGALLGAQLGAVVVSLVTNPVVEAGLKDVVDTLFTDFWGYPGVIASFSEAAGELAAAAVAGTLDTVAPEVAGQLRADPAVQGGVETALGAAMTEFLSDSALWAAVDQTLSAAVISLTTDPVVLDALDKSVQATVEALLGEPLGSVVGPQVGAAVVSLVSNPVVSNALLGVFDSLFSDFFSAPGVVGAFSSAASQWGLVLLTTGSLAAATKAAQDELKASPAVENGVDVSVTAAVAEFLGDTQLWAVVDQTVSSLVATLIGDPPVQEALGQQVSSLVASKIPGPLGQVVGDLVGVAVVSLVTNPIVESALNSLVDTVFSDFWGYPGVVTAFAEAAGALATAALVGDLDTVAPEVQAALRANPDVDAAADLAVGDAVAELLSNTALWAVVDSTLTELVNELLHSPQVQQALYQTVSSTVALLVGEPLGAVVGPQVAAAVVSLVTNPVVDSALKAVVDTLFSDFFGAPGVVDAFASAAGEFAEILVTGGSLAEAENVAQQELKASPAIQNGVDVSVTAAVAELLSNTQLWAVLDQTVSSLVVTVLGDQLVQDALAAQVAATVEKQIKGPLGPVVGEAVGAAVVSLVTNPDVQAGVGAVVDTLFSDFWRSPGVVTAFSEAAGTLALAALTGDLATVAPEVQAALRANPDVDAAVDGSVTAAVAGLLSDQALWAALDATLSSLVDGLLHNPQVDQALYQTVSSAVGVLVGGPLGPVVGDAVATAVVSLLTNPAIEAGLNQLVDTIFSDFFGYPGVIDAYAGAAGDVALVAFTGGDVAAAVAAVKEQLRANPDVDAAVDVAVTNAVAGLLSDRDVWFALDSTLSTLVSGLLTNPEVDQAIYQTVSSTVATLVGGPVGVAVGQQVATAVVSLLANPAIATGLHSFVDTLFSDFFGYPGVIDAFAGAAGDLAVVAFTGGDVAAALSSIEQQLRTDPAIDTAVGVAVSAGVSQLLSDTRVWSALDSTLSSLVVGLISDPVVQQALDAQISSVVSEMVGGGELGAVVGPQVATAVMSLLTDPVVGSALQQMVDTLFTDFFSAPGVISTLSEAAGTLATAAVVGNLAEVAPEVEDSVRNSPEIDAAADNAVSAAVAGFFSNTVVTQAVGSTVTTLATNLLSDAVVQQAAGAAVAALVSGFIGDSPIAAPVGQAVGVAVEQFLATAGVASDLGVIIGSVVPDFFGQPGVAAGLGSAAGAFAVALVQGESLPDSEQIALDDLKSNPQMVAGLEATIADALNLVDTTILSDPTVQQSLGAITTNLVATLAGDTAIQAYVAEQYGAAVAGLLTNQAVVAEISTQLGLAVTELLAYPGVSTAITDALNVFADEYIGGTNEFAALGDALAYLQADPAFIAGVNAVIPDTVNTILADPAVLEAIGVVAQEEAIAALASFGITNKFIGKIVGQVAEGTALSFLTRPAGLGLIDGLAVNLVLGLPLSEVENYILHEVVYSAKVRYALGLSIGQGIGSLFGDNIVGRLIGIAAGVPITVTLGVVAGFERFYDWLSSGWAVAPDVNPSQAPPAASALPNGSHYFQPVPAATDLYVMNAVLLDRGQAAAAREAITGDGRLTLTGLTLNDPDADQPGSVDITMSLDAADRLEGENPLALLAFRFPLDRLVPAAGQTTSAPADDTTVERVS